MYILAETDGLEEVSLVSTSAIQVDCEAELANYRNSRGLPMFVDMSSVK